MILDDFRFKLAIESIVDADVRETALFLIGEKERADGLEAQVEQLEKEAEEHGDEGPEIDRLEEEVETLKKQVAKYVNEVANIKALGPKLTPKPAYPKEGADRIMASKFPGKCGDCGGDLAVGKMIRWNPINKARHLEGECND
jgi:hypothetical protein